MFNGILIEKFRGRRTGALREGRGGGEKPKSGSILFSPYSDPFSDVQLALAATHARDGLARVENVSNYPNPTFGSLLQVLNDFAMVSAISSCQARSRSAPVGFRGSKQTSLSAGSPTSFSQQLRVT